MPPTNPFPTLAACICFKDWLRKRCSSFYRRGSRVRSAPAKRYFDARRSRLREEFVREGGFQSLAIAAAAISMWAECLGVS
jgi:hypothetical protein